MKTNEKKGISLIVLIITIVVIIILAAAVILTINKNNPIESAKKATFLNDLSSYQDELSMYIGNEYINSKGTFDLVTLNGKALEEVISVNSKYNEKFTIRNGKIVGTDKLTGSEKEWADNITNGETGTVIPPQPEIPVPNGGSIYKDKNGVNVPIPSGFVVSALDEENTVKNGLVIKMGNDPNAKDTDVNEFVWIPVDDITEMYDEATNRGKIYDFSAGRVSTLKANCLTTTDYNREPSYLTNNGMDNSEDKHYGLTETVIQNDFDQMIASVKKFGGFYIGRFETGDLSKSKAVIKKLNTYTGNKTWYTIYKLTKNIVNNEYAQTMIIWGCQWDATLRWMNKDESVGDYATDASGKGNFTDQTFKYTKADGTIATKPLNSSIIIPTGGFEGAKVKNIYDMAGNVWDMTYEATGYGGGQGRVIRGGSKSSSNRSYIYPVNNYNENGSRAQLYLK